MKQRLLAAIGLFCGSAMCSAAEFERPVRLKADGVAIRVESPGYAAPCWADVDGDGKKDLLVGQFSQGRIRIFKNLGHLAQGGRPGRRSARRLVMHEFHSTVCGHRR